jgi:hypothetical protein
MPFTGDSAQVRVGPGWLLVAPLSSTEPTDLTTAWNAAWVQVGYTDDGSSFVFDQTFEDVTVAEEYDPIDTLQTARSITINFAAAEITAENLHRAFNGGTIDTSGGQVTFEPPDAGDFTPIMLGWEAGDGLERWVFRRCVQVGSVEIARRKAPQKATIPMSFKATKPTGASSFLYIGDDSFGS